MNTPEAIPPTANRPTPALSPAVPPALVLQVNAERNITGVGVSADGKLFATGRVRHHRMSPSKRYWHASPPMRCTHPILTGRATRSTSSFTADARCLLFSGGIAPTVWDIAAGRIVHIARDIRGDGRFTADGRHFWEYRMTEKTPKQPGDPHGEFVLWNIAGGKVERTLPGLHGALQDISRDGTRAATLLGTRTPPILALPGMCTCGMDPVTVDPQFVIWDLRTGKEITRLNGMMGNKLDSSTAAFSGDGRKFAASDYAVQWYGAPGDPAKRSAAPGQPVSLGYAARPVATRHQVDLMACIETVWSSVPIAINSSGVRISGISTAEHSSGKGWIIPIARGDISTRCARCCRMADRCHHLCQ